MEQNLAVMRRFRLTVVIHTVIFGESWNPNYSVGCKREIKTNKYLKNQQWKCNCIRHVASYDIDFYLWA